MAKVIDFDKKKGNLKDFTFRHSFSQRMVKTIDSLNNEQLEKAFTKLDRKIRTLHDKAGVLREELERFIDQKQIESGLIILNVLLDYVEDMVNNFHTEDEMPYADKLISLYDKIYNTEIAFMIQDVLEEVNGNEVGLVDKDVPKE